MNKEQLTQSARKTPVSPRIASLASQLKQGDTDTLDSFWQEVSEQGTPLIESRKSCQTHSLVTFVWRANSATDRVTLLSSLSRQSSSESRLKRLFTTDLWYRTYSVRNDLRATYRFLVDGNSHADPYNCRTMSVPADNVSPYGNVATSLSLLRLPGTSPLPWSTPLSSQFSGQVNEHTLYSTLSDNSYRAWIYTPPRYTRSGEPYHLLLLLDGWAYIHVLQIHTLLDNLLDVGALPPLVAIMLGHPDRETRAHDLAFSLPFLDFITQELLPWARIHYHVAHDPASAIVGGLSLSAVTATMLALRHPDLFGNVLSQSGSFHWKLPGDTEHERLARLVVETPPAPLRFHLDVGLLETSATTDGGPSLLVSNRHMRNLLQARGYPIHYEEFNGGHDYICWQEMLVDGLLALSIPQAQPQTSFCRL